MPVNDLLKVIERRLDRVEDVVTKPEAAADLKYARELVTEIRLAPLRGEDALINMLQLGMLLERLGIPFDARMASRKATKEYNKAKRDKTRARILRIAEGVPDDRYRASKIAKQLGITPKTVREHIRVLKEQGKL